MLAAKNKRETVKIVVVTATPASNHFLRTPAFRKGEKRTQKWAQNPDPFLEPSRTQFKGSEKRAHFWVTCAQPLNVLKFLGLRLSCFQGP